MEIGGGGEADSSPQKCTLVIMPWDKYETEKKIYFEKIQFM